MTSTLPPVGSTSPFIRLFEPCPVGKRTARNRIVHAPMSVCYGDTDGLVTRPEVEHYARRGEVLEVYPDGLLREVDYRGERACERITFTPGRRVEFKRTTGTTLGTIHNDIEGDNNRGLVLRFTFSLEKDGLPHLSGREVLLFHGGRRLPYICARHPGRDSPGRAIHRHTLCVTTAASA